MKQEYLFAIAGLAGLYLWNKNKENAASTETGKETGSGTGTETSGDAGSGTSGDINKIGDTIAKDAGAIAAILTALTGFIMSL